MNPATYYILYCPSCTITITVRSLGCLEQLKFACRLQIAAVVPVTGESATRIPAPEETTKSEAITGVSHMFTLRF